MNPYVRRGGVLVLGLIIGYLLTTTPLLRGHLDQVSATILIAIALSWFVG